MIRLASSLFGLLGLEVRRKRRREGWDGVIAHLASRHFHPLTIIDVGAARGDFYHLVKRYFAFESYIMIEPLQEWYGTLDSLALADGRISVIHKAAWKREGKIEFHVHDDLFGSSAFREIEGRHVDGALRSVECTTLDGISSGLRGPALLKIDVQGAEREVIEGAKKFLQQVEVAIIETSFFPFYIGGAEAWDIIQTMKEAGFVIYDITGLSYRPLDSALAQADLVFVKESGIFRKDARFANDEQRAKLIKRAKKAI